MSVAPHPPKQTMDDMSFCLRFAKTHPSAIMPTRCSAFAAGYDLFASAKEEKYTIYPGRRVIIPTGIAIELPRGLLGCIRPRSGLALRFGVTVMNAPGTIDSDYRGEIKVVLVNHGDDLCEFLPGERVAQMVFIRHEVADWVETSVDNLAPFDRGTGGFGSTGV